MLLLTLRGVSSVSFVLAPERVLSPRLVEIATWAEVEQISATDTHRRIAVLKATENRSCVSVEPRPAWGASVAVRQKKRIAISKGSSQLALATGGCVRISSPRLVMHVVVQGKSCACNPPKRVGVQSIAHIALIFRLLRAVGLERRPRCPVDLECKLISKKD